MAIKIEERTITANSFETSDGWTFDDEYEARRHEVDLQFPKIPMMTIEILNGSEFYYLKSKEDWETVKFWHDDVMGYCFDDDKIDLAKMSFPCVIALDKNSDVSVVGSSYFSEINKLLEWVFPEGVQI